MVRCYLVVVAQDAKLNGEIALNANRLHAEIIKTGATINDVSDLLGITRVATQRKLADIKRLTIGEALILKEFLELTDSEAATIFLGVNAS